MTDTPLPTRNTDAQTATAPPDFPLAIYAALGCTEIKYRSSRKLYAAAEQIARFVRSSDEYTGPLAALEQIAIVCTDNMARSCDHRMALDFVRQIANDASTKARGLSTDAAGSNGDEATVSK